MNSEIKTFIVCALIGVAFIIGAGAVSEAVCGDSTEIWGQEDSRDVQWKIVYTDMSEEHFVCSILPHGLNDTIYIETVTYGYHYEWKSVEMTDVLAIYEIDDLNEWKEIWHN